MFLTKDQMQELTGYKYIKKQLEWLNNHGYPYEVNKTGQPKVLITYLESKIGSDLPTSKRTIRPPNKLNLVGLNQ